MTSVARVAVAHADRMVVKVGSSSLTDKPTGLATDRLDALVEAISARRLSGRQVVLVSSGAIAAGLAPLRLRRRPRDLATQQAAASVGQSLLVHAYALSFARYGLTVGQVLLTAEDLIRRSHYRNAQRNLERLLDLGVVPIVNENDAVATAEIRFGDNDRLAALVAHVLHADALVLLSDVDGLYDGDPRRPGAQLVPQVAGADDLAGVQAGRSGSGVGTGGMASKVDAATVATSAGVHVVLASAPNAAAAMAGAQVGTWFTPTGRRLPTRLLWLKHASTPHGRLTLDAGAVAAVVERRLSLLSVGVTAVEGEFEAGDPVDVCDPAGHAVARGLVAYAADELPPLLGRATHDLSDRYRREVIHRDDLVLL
ncbi:glutamate 5-kinase [Fodinicola feengrottensis]|uniref:Glutamate 5-kinase n=1 Tax=Fodinicola feengrottensis TaxID=435914 RepID=A0ABP4U7S1_9ACTN